jgi:hypothetical protein
MFNKWIIIAVVLFVFVVIIFIGASNMKCTPPCI